MKVPSFLCISQKIASNSECLTFYYNLDWDTQDMSKHYRERDTE